MSKIIGKITIRVDGAEIPAENGSSVTPDGYKRNHERHGGRKYYNEEETNAMLEANVLLTKDVDVIYLSNIVDATVHIETDTGLQYVMREATTEEAVELNGEGKAAIKMFGQALEKI